MQRENGLMHPHHQNHDGSIVRQVAGPGIPVIPAKRPDTEIDDVQFISSKPVKRQKVEHPTASPVANTVPVQPVQPLPQPNSQPVSQSVPRMDCDNSLTTPITSAPIAGNETTWLNSEINYSHDRRTTTGMVGLPSGFSDWEAIFGYRGCSLPELEGYSMSAVRHKPAIISSPAISPKHIPQTLASEPLQPEGPQCSQTVQPSPDPPLTPITNATTSREPIRPHEAALMKAQREETAGAVESCSEKVAENTPTAPHQSPLPCNNRSDQQQQQQMPLPGVEQHISIPDRASQPHASKQPCKACIQMQQRAAFARAQGLPFVNPSMPLHMLPPGPYHSTFSSQGHPHLMPAMQAGMLPYGPGSSPMMMPMNMHSYTGAVMPSSVLSQQHAAQAMPLRPAAQQQQQHQLPTAQISGPGLNNATNMAAGSAAKPSASAATTSVDTALTAATRPPESPAKQPRPPAPAPIHPSLQQPTYRKPSPNLIVDVAETCQEKFPFEAVAQRHATTVDKVADVFAAIIQVPLLRCPQDRRRAGRLAHERVKEYNRTKRELQEAAVAAEAAKGQGGNTTSSSSAYGFGEQQGRMAVGPLDIANALGPTGEE
ncbi:hypothetical protein PG991_002717 [Apiospora marii]|uniref:Uncharacterized protein n=1 Tax=Apiospora marii TaxID=335849 RepID=A0ABR1SHU8_9PEZI